MQKQKESLSASMAKLVMAVSLIVGIGSIFGMFGYFWMMPKSEVVINNGIEKEEIIKDETADWKTYRNEEYGFEVKYPRSPEWVVEEAKIVDPKAVEPIKSIINIFPKNKVYLVEESRIDPITIMISSGSLEDYYRVYPKSKDAIEEKVLINNLSFVRQVDGKGMAISFKVEDSKKNLSFAITSHINEFTLDVSEKKLLEDIFNQILSTFKFIESEK